MTWNVENLFPPGHQISPGKTVKEADYRAKLKYLAKRIIEVKPDVLGLQEVGARNNQDTQTLDDLQNELQGKYPFKALASKTDGRGIRVGFLSKLKIHSVNEIVDFPAGEFENVPDWAGKKPIKKMGRAALQIEVEPFTGTQVQVIVLHLKSKLVNYPKAGGGTSFSPKDENQRATGSGLGLLRRTAEAITVRFHLNQLMKSASHVIVMGDFNDEPLAATSQIFLGPVDADVTTDNKTDKFSLYNLVDSISRKGGPKNDKKFLRVKERFSRVGQGRNELLDHILVSKSLLGESKDLKKDIWKVKKVRILTDSIVNESVGVDPEARIGRDHPDHAPVFVRFAL
jgi:endonuclease/exonuclease/phosphatase family metal-dependent hydrolase